MGPGLNPNCWHCEQDRGWFSHMYWDCPEARRFWNKILKIINEVFKAKLSIVFNLMTMGLLGNTAIEKGVQFTFKAMILAGKATIALGWKDRKKWTEEVWSNYLFDFIQSDIVAVTTQETSWKVKAMMIKTKWKLYFQWIITTGGKDIRWKLMTLCPWLRSTA